MTAGGSGVVLWAYTLTTFLSALLLFSVQPMFAKMVLPVLGGSPSVWAVAVFFFQAALLVGYCYAHLLINKAPPRMTGTIHLAVCLLALVCLPIALPSSWGEPPPGEPYLWQLGLFTVAIGLPFLAVSANAPLLQAWFARTGHPHGHDPYFLYAASNLGSLIALLGYPFVLEPAFGLKALSGFWAFGFLLLMGALGGVFLLMLRRADATGSEPALAETPRRGSRRPSDLARSAGLGRAGAGALGAADGLHDARHDRRRLRAAAVGAAAVALSAHLRAGVPRALADPAAGAAGAASDQRGRGPVGAVADQARRMVADGNDRRHRVLHVGDGGAPHALRGAAGGAISDRVLSLDGARRRARRHVGGADRAAHLQRGVRVSAAAGALDGLPAGCVQHRGHAAAYRQHSRRAGARDDRPGKLAVSRN